MVYSIAKDSLVHVHPSTSTQRSTFFRLMDLPIELRLRIVEYALASDRPLYWVWLTYHKSKKVGSFKNLEKLTPIARVSRPLHAETKFVVWQVNAFEFVESCFGIGYHSTFFGTKLTDHSAGLHFSGLLKACRVFLHKLPAARFKHKGWPMTLRCTFSLGAKAQMRSSKSFNDLCSLFPIARFKLEVYHWFLTTQVPDSSWEPLVWDTSTFMQKGRDLQASMSACNFGGKERGCRLIPGLNDDLKVLEDSLSGDELEMALRWFEHGL